MFPPVLEIPSSPPAVFTRWDGESDAPSGHCLLCSACGHAATLMENMQFHTHQHTDHGDRILVGRAPVVDAWLRLHKKPRVTMGGAPARRRREAIAQAQRDLKLSPHEIYHLIGVHSHVGDKLLDGAIPAGGSGVMESVVDLAQVLDLSLDTLFSHAPAKANPDLRWVYTLDDQSRVTLERTTQGDGPARERVQELRNRGVAAFWTSAFIPEAYM